MPDAGRPWQSRILGASSKACLPSLLRIEFTMLATLHESVLILWVLPQKIDMHGHCVQPLIEGSVVCVCISVKVVSCCHKKCLLLQDIFSIKIQIFYTIILGQHKKLMKLIHLVEKIYISASDHSSQCNRIFFSEVAAFINFPWNILYST